jgi:hypothetical protein
MNTSYLTSNPLAQRTHYKSSGAIDPGRFLLWLVPALVVAVLLAALMFWLFNIGHYYIIIVPFICALAVAGMVRLAVVKGHCRNRLVGSLAGFLLGTILYFGSYYIGMIYHWGGEVVARPDILVEYIRIRLATDVVRDVHTPDNEDDRPSRRSGSSGMNWFRLAIESIGVIAIVTAAAASRSRKTYCETCKCWLTRETTPFEPDKANALIESLQTGSARALAALCATPPYTTIPNTTLAVEYCPSLKEGRTRDCPVFVSLKNITANPKGVTLDNFDQATGKMLERCLQLTADELPALAPRFPVFETFAGRAAVASLLPKEESDERRKAQEPEGAPAEIISLGSEHQGKVLTRKMIWIGNGFALAGLVGFLGGMLLLAFGATLLEKVGKGTSDAKGFGIALCVAGGVAVLTALAGILFDSSFGGNRMLRKKFRAELQRRTGVFVQPDDPDALFVEIVPKLNWGKMMLDNASDIGLLVVDKARREIRFEGDKERWRLPGAGITGCEVEHYVQGHGAGATKIFFTVLRAARREGFWEAPVRERRGAGVLSSKRKKLASRLTAAIQEIRGNRS